MLLVSRLVQAAEAACTGRAFAIPHEWTMDDIGWMRILFESLNETIPEPHRQEVSAVCTDIAGSILEQLGVDDEMHVPLSVPVLPVGMNVYSVSQLVNVKESTRFSSSVSVDHDVCQGFLVGILESTEGGLCVKDKTGRVFCEICNPKPEWCGKMVWLQEFVTVACRNGGMSEAPDACCYVEATKVQLLSRNPILYTSPCEYLGVEEASSLMERWCAGENVAKYRGELEGVVGIVRAVSQLSKQYKQRGLVKSCLFFAELLPLPPDNEEVSLHSPTVQVLFDGETATKWYPFISCDTCLSFSHLQFVQLSPRSFGAKILLRTTPQTEVVSLFEQCTYSVPMPVDPFESLVHYQGTITSISPSEGFYVLDERYTLIVTHYHFHTAGRGWRVGAEVELMHVHPVYDDAALVGFGCCQRSHIRVISFSSDVHAPFQPFSPSIALLSNWHGLCFSDFKWFLEVVRDIRSKFGKIFKESRILGYPGADGCYRAGIVMLLQKKMHFPHVKRDVYGEFLEHSHSCCLGRKKLNFPRFYCIQDIVKMKSLSGNGAYEWHGELYGSDELPPCLLLGRLCGVHTGGVVLKDDTGVVNVVCDRVDSDDLDCIWLIRKFSLVIEAFVAPEGGPEVPFGNAGQLPNERVYVYLQYKREDADKVFQYVPVPQQHPSCQQQFVMVKEKRPVMMGHHTHSCSATLTCRIITACCKKQQPLLYRDVANGRYVCVTDEESNKPCNEVLEEDEKQEQKKSRVGESSNVFFRDVRTMGESSYGYAAYKDIMEMTMSGAALDTYYTLREGCCYLFTWLAAGTDARFSINQAINVDDIVLTDGTHEFGGLEVAGSRVRVDSDTLQRVREESTHLRSQHVKKVRDVLVYSMDAIKACHRPTISIQCVVVKKGIRTSWKSDSFAAAACKLEKKLCHSAMGPVGQVYVQGRDVDGMDTVDIYINHNASQTLLPFGLLPGAVCVFLDLMVIVSAEGVHLKACNKTRIHVTNPSRHVDMCIYPPEMLSCVAITPLCDLWIPRQISFRSVLVVGSMVSLKRVTFSVEGAVRAGEGGQSSTPECDCSIYCVLDDGSAQADVNMQGECAWELLGLSQRQREDVVKIVGRCQKVTVKRGFEGDLVEHCGEPNELNLDEQRYFLSTCNSMATKARCSLLCRPSYKVTIQKNNDLWAREPLEGFPPLNFKTYNLRLCGSEVPTRVAPRISLHCLLLQRLGSADINRMARNIIQLYETL